MFREEKVQIPGNIESVTPKRYKPDYDNELYLHQLQELHQWAMELQGACMHHEGDSVNHKEEFT